ncbi:MAG: T9SS type A sorting domain-containing protein [bacterium]|nr:T9SS type A sorting domain-containing protein [bacterium]
MGIVRNLLLLILVAALIPGVSSEVKADPAWYPEITLPDDSTILTCSNDSICFEVIASDPDTNDIVSLLLIEGPVLFDSIGGHPPVSANVCFLPDSVGTYRFIWKVRDLWGKFVIDTVTFTVDYGSAPTVADQSFSARLCNLNDPRLLPLAFDSSGIGSVDWSLLSGPGTIDPNTGAISYFPDTAGSYSWTVVVSNWCGADTALITDQVSINNPPQVMCDDRVFYLCEPEEICFDVFGHDPDGDSIEIRLVQGAGTFSMNSDTSGLACFDPAAVDSADYFFVFRAADSCMTFTNDPTDCVCVDTCRVTVVINQAPELSCPGPLEIPACFSDSLFCFDISASDPEGDVLIYDVISGNATITGQTVCVNPNQADSIDVVITATDSCGQADSCTIPILTASNQPPVATTGNDFEMFLCAPEQICVSALAYDPEGEIASAVSNIGTYNSSNNTICFTPDTAGLYSVILTVTDSCGAVDADTTLVGIEFNDLPVITVGDDFSFDICGSREICFPINVVDQNIHYVSSSIGGYNVQTGEVCFTADTAGLYTVVVEVGDGCDQIASDTINIIVTEQESPVVSLGSDTSLALCQTEEICLDYSVAGAYDSIYSNIGTLNPAESNICFTPVDGGTYTLVLTAFGACGSTVADTMNITVDLAQPPVIADFYDTTIYLCFPQYICIPFTTYDLDGDIMSITSNTGYVQGGEICFQGRSSGAHEIILTVTDSCGNVAVDTALVDIQTDQAVQLNLPDDTVIFACQLDTLCFPVGQIPVDADVTVNGINTWYNAESGTLCYYSDCGNTNRISMSVTTECGVYVDSFTVTSICNSPPLVILPPDTAMQTCEIAEVCLPVGISDVDDNVADVQVTGAVYDPTFGQVCFTPDTSGTYHITIQVTDTCGETDSDEIYVTVQANQPPTCNLPGDTTIFMCLSDTIRMPVSGSDPDGNFAACEIVSGPGQIIEGFWVYEPTATGQVLVTVRCYDDCGLECSGSFVVDLELNTAPVCEADIDTTIGQCTPEEVCIPLSATDAENNLVSTEIVSGGGEIIEGSFCYTPTGTESISSIIRFTDECGEFCEQTINLDFTVNNPPQAFCPGDTSLILCDLTQICLDGFGSSDPDGNILSETTSLGSLTEGTICFDPVVGQNRIVYTVTDECGAVDSCVTLVNVPLNSAPICDIPNDTSISVCLPAEICLPVTASDVDGDLAGCQIISGPGTLSEGFWCYTPTMDESVTVTIRCSDACGLTCESSFTLSIDVNQAPIADDSTYSEFYCFSGETRQIQVVATDPDGSLLDFSLISGTGTIDNAGLITYAVDTAGTYQFVVEVSDSCSVDTARITDVIDINTPPEFTGFDTTVYLCTPEEICFDIFAYDADFDYLNIYQSDGIGQFVQIDSVSGRTCFTPEDIAQATYTFVYCVSDGCVGADKNPISFCDTVNVTVIMNRAPEITCPEPIFAAVCGIDTVCFDVSVYDPDGDQTTVNLLSGNALIDGSNICFVASENGSFGIMIEAIDECGATDTCTVPVTVTSNSAPIVSTAPDSALILCDVQEICIDANVIDNDGDLSSVIANLGQYNPSSGTICFTPDTAGIYEIILTATDSCGSYDADTSVVTVELNASPVVTMPEDFLVTLCSDSLVCFGTVLIQSDGDIEFLNGPAGYDSQSGEICFTADTTGIYTFVVEAIDSCGLSGSDTTLVTVVGHTSPSVSLGEDQNLQLCDISEVCVDVNSSGELLNLISNLGAYNSQAGQVCFTPDTSGYYQMIVTVTDTCGFMASDTVGLNIELNSAPLITNLPDSSFYLCYPRYICVPADFSDIDGNIASVSVSQGYYSNGMICFMPRSFGQYEVILTVTDSCGLSAVDTALVDIRTDQDVSIGVPNDTTIFSCVPDTMCFPITGIPAWANVTVNGINTWYDAATQTVCYYSDCGTTNHISITATTECGEYTGSFTVVSVCNSRPLVILPPDETVTLCEPDSICIPVGISDADDNISEISVTGGVYDPVFGQICLAIDGPGTYTVTVMAQDSCGAADSDQMIIEALINSAPQIISYPIDTVITVCDLDSICLPFNYTDIDGNLMDGSASLGHVDLDAGYLCFLPDTSGYYCLELTLRDSCGLTDQAIICVDVQQQSSAYVTVADSSVFLCNVGDICVPVQVSGSYNNLTTNLGQFGEGMVCFTADTTGIYELMVITEADCNTDTAVGMITVSIGTSVAIACPGDTAVALCGPDTLAFDFGLQGTYDSLEISAPAFVDGDSIRVPLSSSGVVTVSLIAYSTCGVDSCSFDISSTMNSRPIVNVGADFETVTCELTEVCFPYSVADLDGNVVSVVSSHGTVVDDTTVCFTPTSYGVSTVIVTAEDACGAIDMDTIKITVSHGGNAVVICPENTQYATLCGGPDSVCIPVSVTPSTASVTVLPNGSYDPASGTICVYVENDGISTVTVAANGLCGADTCSFTLNTTFKELAAINCPAPLAVMACVENTDSLCIPVEITGTGVSVNVNPFGTYAGGAICFPVDSAGDYELEIIAYNDCNADTCYAQVNILSDPGPTLTLPSDTTIFRCASDTELICIEGIFASDAQDTASLVQTCGAGTFELVGPSSGNVCFRPDSIGVYEFCYESDDGCSSAQGSFLVTIQERIDCDVCVRVSIDGGGCVPVGIVQNVDVNVESNDYIGGFELLIGYDVSVLSFRSAVISGGAIEGWEYFTYRILDNGSCGGACPGGMIRLVGIADANNGALHPPEESLRPNGRLVRMQYQIANDQNLGDQFLPISFFWFDCADNSFSNRTGDDLYIDSRIKNAERLIIWDEAIDAIYPESSRPFGLGAPDSCIGSKPTVPIRCVEFINGGICVVHPDTIDDRGDINLNEVPYEIADAVLFSNYFVYGISVFVKNPAGQTAATDVNADGLTLTVADLVELIRVIIGDANPTPKPVTPYPDQLVLSEEIINDVLHVRSEAVSSIGAAHLIYSLNGEVEISDVTAGLDATNMDMAYSVIDKQLRVLIYNIGENSIPEGSRELLEIKYEGSGSIELVASDFVDYFARQYSTDYKGSALPHEFSLNQNYPNPFNPLTTISFSLPRQSDWEIEIYNITGKLVRQFRGSSGAGQVSFDWDGTAKGGTTAASGIYFYRLKASDFSATKKMVLLK